MNAEQVRLDSASRSALARRARLKAGAAAIRQRLAPTRLVQDGKTHVATQAKAVVADGEARVRAHPFMAGLLVSGLLAWIFRKPLLRYAPPLAQRGYDWLAGKLPFSEIGAEGYETDETAGNVECQSEPPNGPDQDSSPDPDATTYY
ncbi:hypothetical protein GV829_10390 [Sphingomonas lacunae]|uniref:DUF3618 domain-containing protein n=1 Tax=Sphingomonas lacunae TaxID=2698828 RepID=A0A6M4AWQ1_9SPHN|nr:hypothetical protein [Sphingomonas lacunae]QJQ32800.1 hypothetical protein GV829_10390 [Sphingomonas lacunae]